MESYTSVAYALPSGWGRSFWGPVTWADAIMALGIVLIAVLLNALLVWLLRRAALSLRGRLRGTMQPQLFHALGKPAYALTWAVALYLASIPIVTALDLAFLIPWWIGGFKVHGGGFHAMQLLTMWGPLTLMGAFVWWTIRLRRRARAELARLANADATQ